MSNLINTINHITETYPNLEIRALTDCCFAYLKAPEDFDPMHDKLICSDCGEEV